MPVEYSGFDEQSGGGMMQVGVVMLPRLHRFFAAAKEE
jgi:hypothetical protein